MLPYKRLMQPGFSQLYLQYKLCNLELDSYICKGLATRMIIPYSRAGSGTGPKITGLLAGQITSLTGKCWNSPRLKTMLASQIIGAPLPANSSSGLLMGTQNGFGISPFGKKICCGKPLLTTPDPGAGQVEIPPAVLV